MGQFVLDCKSSPLPALVGTSTPPSTALARCLMFKTCSIVAVLFCLNWWVYPSYADERGLEFFEAKIRPVLVERCQRCHSVGAKAPKGGLRLDTPAGLLKGGDSGAVIAPGKADDS